MAKKKLEEETTLKKAKPRIDFSGFQESEVKQVSQESNPNYGSQGVNEFSVGGQTGDSFGEFLGRKDQ